MRALVDLKSGHLPDPRINVSHRTDGRDISVLLLIDLSQSLNETLPGCGQTILATARFFEHRRDELPALASLASPLEPRPELVARLVRCLD